MKGIIFNLLEELVIDQYGDDAWDAMVDEAGVDGSYTSLGTYPFEDLEALLGAASRALETPVPDLLRWYGNNAIPLFATRYPSFFDGPRSTREFLLTLNHIIHPEVQKLYPGAEVPQFEFDESSADSLDISYQSPRKLCALAEGLAMGVADHYRQTMEIEQPRCMLRGDDLCLLRVTFPRI